ncbi:16S rRNA pseudouridine(516) synthase [Paenibacillus nuruki]|uniref:Pseudouridine synthase n=2 Tax=Paenibacillus nuruki TaxID=1886670 RepID=A0A1E3L370_9BACL|nr:16S rRNA pseudouridine(516) synthase [Paenibacillus nuruki]
MDIKFMKTSVKKQRVDKILGNLGYGTRSELKRAAKQGRIKVNDEVVKDNGLQIDPYQEKLEFDGEQVNYREYIYLLMNKPQGVISATEDRHDSTVVDLLDIEYQVFEPFPVGRLDKDTEGLLLITNDGRLAHELLSPRKHVPKTYEADVLGEVTEDDIVQFSKGVTLEDGYVTLPAELQILNHTPSPEGTMSQIRLTISEGKFHQVKRMFESVGKKVTFLKRVSMGALQLDPTLPTGEYRELTAEELVQIGRGTEQ